VTPMSPVVSAALVVACAVAARAAWYAQQAHGARSRFAPAPAMRVRARRVRAPARVTRWAREGGVSLDVDAAWSMWLVVLVVGTCALLVVAGPGAAAVLLAALVSTPTIALATSVRSRRRRVSGTLPGALDEIARSLRSGGSLVQAIADAAHATPGAIGDDLFEVAAAHRAGVPLADALARWRTNRPIPGVRLTASALELGLAAGGAHARAIDGVAATLRDNLAITAEVRAQAAQAQASALVIGLAPIGFTALACLADHRTATFLFQTPAGLACLAIGLALDAAGAIWMGRITRTRE
jgi:tight adherence protein B